MAYYTPTQRQALAVRPGITSAASLAYRHEQQILAGPDWETLYCTTVLPDKLTIDLDYLARRTLISDLTLVAKTVFAMLR